MVDDISVSIIDSNKTFTPLVFYTDFLNKLADFYSSKNSKAIVFRFFEKGDSEIYGSKYSIDPIALPLLLSIIEQLSKFHQRSLDLLLNNNHATLEALEFLSNIDFFKIAGKKTLKNPNGNDLLNYNDIYLAQFRGKPVRKEHIIRSYKKADFAQVDFTLGNEILLRDQVNSLASYYVQQHFEELLFNYEHTRENHNTYIDILSELITNGIVHSKSTTYAMMFVDKNYTRFSISDNGIGLKDSHKNKTNFPFYYEKDEFRNSIKISFQNFNIDYVNNLLDIFETLFYSSLKDRKGLFDLMIKVVLHGNGRFRLHTDCCQIIISNRVFKYISLLSEIREGILSLHSKMELGVISIDYYKEQLLKLKNEMKVRFEKMVTSTLKYYSEETKYSSIRFFKVRFKGVHIEVEIPN